MKCGDWIWKKTWEVVHALERKWLVVLGAQGYEKGEFSLMILAAVHAVVFSCLSASRGHDPRRRQRQGRQVSPSQQLRPCVCEQE